MCAPGGCVRYDSQTGSWAGLAKSTAGEGAWLRLVVIFRCDICVGVVRPGTTYRVAAQ